MQSFQMHPILLKFNRALLHLCRKFYTTISNYFVDLSRIWADSISLYTSEFCPSDHELTQAFSIPFSSHHSDTVLSIQRMLFQNYISYLTFLFFRLISGMHLVVNPLYLLFWSLYCRLGEWYAYPWRVFFTCLNGVKWSFGGCSDLFVLQSSPVLSFFSQCTKLLIWPLHVPTLSLMDLFCFCILRMAC